MSGPGERTGPPWAVLGGLLIAGTFASIALWSFLSVPPDPARANRFQPIQRQGAVGSATGELALPPEVTPPPEGPRPAGIEKQSEVPEILNLTFLDRGALVRLRSILAPRTVTIINVWATWCGPCRREFASLRERFSGWESDVRFVPIQLGDEPPGELEKTMPDAAHHLVDLVSGGSVQRVLRTRGLAEEAKIPITLVLDCQFRLRWLHLEEIQDFDEFALRVEELRRVLRTGACAPPAPPAGSGDPPEFIGPQKTSPKARCGDGKMDYAGGEDCHSCPADFPCMGRECVPSEKGRWLCSDAMRLPDHLR
jgi:thiol-disulfide isomerase/thioredoxin